MNQDTFIDISCIFLMFTPVFIYLVYLVAHSKEWKSKYAKSPPHYRLYPIAFTPISVLFLSNPDLQIWETVFWGAYETALILVVFAIISLILELLSGLFNPNFGWRDTALCIGLLSVCGAVCAIYFAYSPLVQAHKEREPTTVGELAEQTYTDLVVMANWMYALAAVVIATLLIQFYMRKTKSRKNV